MAKYKVKNTTILHDGVSKGEGSIIELTDKQAEKLADYIELIKDKAPAKQTTEKTKTKTETKKPEVKTEGDDKDGGESNGK
jgi:predicted house-cleaning noncanonical NTP pyrophosphatase (MazG superfamily)